MTMNSGSNNGLPIAGWYVDPQNATQLRWWDGAQWGTQTTPVPQPAAPAPTPSPAYAPQQGVPQYGEYAAPGQAPAASVAPYAAAAQQPYGVQQSSAAPQYAMAPVQARVAEGTPTSNWFIWILALSPLFALIQIFTVDYRSFVVDPYSTDSQALNSMQLMTDPGYVIASLSGWIVFALTILFAVLDYRWLGKQGYQRRFHWAWTILASLIYVIGRSVVVKRQAGRGAGPMWVGIGALVLTLIGFGIWMALIFAAVFETVSLTPGIVS